jgi:hypothetical protein
VICPTGKSVQFCLMSLRASASRGEKSRAPKFQFREPIQADLGRPDVLQKIFRLARDPKSSLQFSAIPPPQAALRDRHGRWKRDAVDALAGR